MFFGWPANTEGKWADVLCNVNTVSGYGKTYRLIPFCERDVDTGINSIQYFIHTRVSQIQKLYGIILSDYLQNLPKHARIAGITHDEFTKGLEDDAKAALINVGLDLSTDFYRSSLCFVFIPR